MNVSPSRSDSRGAILSLPSVIWLVIFFAIPLFIMLGVSLLTRGGNPSDYGTPLTLQNYKDIFTEPLVSTLLRSIRIALQSTIICFVIGYPLAVFISTRQNTLVRQFSLFLVILPFWTNFLVRTYSWQIILGRRGVINEILQNQLGLIDSPLQLINTEGAVLLGLVYGFLPFMVLPIYASVERFNFHMVEAAHDLGANDWYAFWKVMFPMTLPGVVAGWILVFIPAIGAFVTPDLLGGTEGFMVGNLITRQFRDNGGSWPRGSAASIVLMIMVGISLFIYQRFASDESYARAGFTDRINRWLEERHIRIPSLLSSIVFWVLLVGFVVYLFTLNWTQTGTAAAVVTAILVGINIYQRRMERHKTESRSYEINPWSVRRDLWLRRIGKWGLAFNPIFSYFFLWSPIFILVLYSFNASRRAGGRWEGFSTVWYDNIFSGVAGSRSNYSTEEMLEAVETSLIIGVVGTIIATILGTMVSLSLERGVFRGKRWVDGLLYLPIVIPDITMGISLLVFFKVVFDLIENITGSRPFPGIANVAIAHIAFNISFVAIVVRARLTDMNPRYEEAARDLGANEWRTFWRITYPLLLPGIVAGALLAFTLSLDDFVITFFVSGGSVTTLTVFVWGLVKRGVPPEINAISTLMILASTTLVLISSLFQRNASRG